MDRRKVARALLVVAMLAMPGRGIASPKLDACLKTAMTQSEITRCAGEEFRRVDVRMNETYRAVLAKATGEPPGTVEKVKAADRAWIAYRDAYMEAMFPAEDKQGAYGSRFPADAALFKARLTQQHTSDLKVLLHQYDHGPR
jgi:uncharacterized protein YecT (DUF1311 family)